ncbi:MAG TPA: ABC transporter ATP-binding protein [Bryobacteraceae bacterium]|nr:ABC transporter ATP-binding protein [Bryobacteraceae bacterium]
MDLLLRYARQQWRPAAEALVFAAVNQVFGMADPFIFRGLIDGYVTSSRPHNPRGFILGTGLWLAAMVAAATIAWAAKTLQLSRASEVSQKVASAMFADGVRHALEMPYADFEHTRSGETLDRLQKLRWRVEHFVAGTINVLFFSLVGVAIVVAYAATVHGLISLYLAFVAVTMVALSIALNRNLAAVHEDAFREGTALAGAATEALRNIELVKSLGLAKREISRLHESSGRMLTLELESIRRIRRFSFFHGACVQTMRLVLTVLLLYFLYRRSISMGQFFALFLYARFLFQPLQHIGAAIQDFSSTEAALEAFRGLLQLPRESSPAQPVRVGTLRSIEFDRVRFQYATALRPALDGLSFRAVQGETIAFVGPSGAGKSTIVKLLSGLYAPRQGQILYNGVRQSEVALDELRERIGLVTQETQLFSGSIRQNLLFVRPEASDADCLGALEQASAQSILRRTGQDLETIIGEGGIRLSGGERQRLAIARALLRRPHLLIFDEATSSLDSLTEREITETIGLLSSRTDLITILIAHRLSTVSRADVIYVLDQGRIVQSGTHAELSANGGLYREMWLQQVNGEGEARGV